MCFHQIWISTITKGLILPYNLYSHRYQRRPPASPVSPTAFPCIYEGLLSDIKPSERSSPTQRWHIDVTIMACAHKRVFTMTWGTPGGPSIKFNKTHWHHRRNRSPPMVPVSFLNFNNLYQLCYSIFHLCFGCLFSTFLVQLLVVASGDTFEPAAYTAPAMPSFLRQCGG